MSWLRHIARVIACTAFAFTAAGAAAQPYSPVDPPQPVQGDGRVEVIEFFWYGCPHCYALEPNVVAWAKKAPKDVVFRRVPAIPSDAWLEPAKMFYTLEAMGKLEQFHQKVFDAIHKDNVNLNNKKIRDEWLTKNGINLADYEKAEKSFSVVTNVNRAKTLTYAYKVDSVPRIAVNGKYYTSAEKAGDLNQVFVIVDQLIGMSRKGKPS